MASVYKSQAAQPALALEVSAAALHLIEGVINFFAYRRTVAQLSRLNNRQLSDLGINRSDIATEATKAVYGTR